MPSPASAHDAYGPLYVEENSLLGSLLPVLGSLPTGTVGHGL